MDSGIPVDAIDDVAVILLAAGPGTRLGAKRPKAFVGLGDRVLLAWSLDVFEQHPAVDSIVLVVPEGWKEPAAILIDDLGCDRVSSIEVGASTRAGSVLAGLAAVADRRETAVLVHDAARPLVTSQMVDRTLAGLADGFDVVVPTLPVYDTIKQVDASGVVVATPPRDSLRAAQTPQACRASVLRAALEAIPDDEMAAVTDCAQAIERAGGRVLAVEGDTRARKLTTLEDLRSFEQQLGIGAPVPVADHEGGNDDDDTHSGHDDDD